MSRDDMPSFTGGTRREEMVGDYFKPEVDEVDSRATGFGPMRTENAPDCHVLPQLKYEEHVDVDSRTITHWPDPYNSLAAVLREAYEQASAGKGRERHASGEPFEQQTICQTIRAHGIGFGTGQAEKKGRESHKLLKMENGTDRAVAELLGAINYLAAAIIVIRGPK